MKSGLANRTANLAIDRLHAALEWGVRTRVLAENPIHHIERLPEGEAHQVCKRRSLSNDEIARYLAAALADDRDNEQRVADETKSDSPRTARHHGVRVPQAPLWRFLLEAAARYGEARTLTWGDADLDDCIVTLRAETTKAGKERRIPIRREFADELVALKDIHERALGREPAQRDRVFLTPEGKPWCVASNNLMRVHNRLLIAAGIDRADAQGRKVDLHGLRHTGATRLARSGATLIQTQMILGHSDPKLTAKIYTHLEVEDLRDAVEMAAGSGPALPRLVRTPDDAHLEESA